MLFFILEIHSKVFVGGVGQDTNNSELFQHFRKFGEIASAYIMPDRETGRHRGFGFVTFCSEESAGQAIAIP